MSKFKLISVSLLSIFVLFMVVYVGVSLVSSDEVNITEKNKSEYLDEFYGKINVKTAKEVKGKIDLNPADVAEELPEIDKFEVSVKNDSDLYVEIFSSPEKAGTADNSWLNEVAKDFNKQDIKVNGKNVSVKIRNISSGTAMEYITSGKYVPEGFTPSNEFWGQMVQSKGLNIEKIADKMVGNVPGIVLTKDVHKKLKDKYGKVDAKVVTEAMLNNELVMGYTDPFTSSTGLNFLLSTLYSFDSNPLSEKASSGFEQFQENVPFIASTTLQMREAAQSGTLTGFVMESQIFEKDAVLNTNYVFTPFGVRHDSPLYAVGNISDEKKEILTKFYEFSQKDEYQKLAKEKGFNTLNDYKSTTLPDGNTLVAAQKLWKDKKNAGKTIAAVFVTDVSGSMSGEPINQLKDSLIKGQKYLGRENKIGLVSYSSDVTINLPIKTYNAEHQSNFVGAIESLQANGGTSTNDGIIVAIKLLKEEMEKDENILPIIFVLSDGNSTGGLSFNKTEQLVKAYEIPIYTIGYNANLDELVKLSNINEAANINADTDDVVYKIRNLFNTQM